MAKFYTIDPHTCTIEELKNAIAVCENRVEYYGSLEQGCKKFINSVYGALGSSFYVCANVAIAESVTLQGQDLIKYSVKCVNKFFAEYWNNLEKMFKPAVYLIAEDESELLFKSICTHDRAQYKESIPTDINFEGTIMVIPCDAFGTGLSVFTKSLKKKFGANVGEREIREKKCVVISSPTYELLDYVNKNLSPYARIAYDIKQHDENNELDIKSFIERCKSNGVKFNFGTGETCQIYGDSCVGSTMIACSYSVHDPKFPDDAECYIESDMDYQSVHCTEPDYDRVDISVPIEELFNKYIDSIVSFNGKEYVTPNNLRVRNIDGDRVVYSNVAHIMRHKTQNQIWRVSTLSKSNHVDVTADHSIVVYNTHARKLESVQPRELDYYHRLIVFDENSDTGFVLSAPHVQRLFGSTQEYVYDIEVSSIKDAEHCFFGNDILIHNTDSVSEDSMIRSTKHPEGITIKEFYEENIKNIGDTTLAGHESVHTNDKVLNYDVDFYYGDVARIIRHKVTKPKWRLELGGNQYVECTQDHSLVVLRESNLVSVRPDKIDIENDSVIKRCEPTGRPLAVSIKSISCVGSYEDEYVYDIEMADATHTFMCNDVLVHNSAYITLQPLIDSCVVPKSLETQFILSFNEHVLADYLDGRFIDYAKAYNCKKNLEAFELEKVARSVLMQKKKKYVMDISWKEPNVFLEPLHQLVFKGVEVAKGETSMFVRNEQRQFVEWIMDSINNDRKLRYPEIVARLRQIKQRFEMAPIDDICKNTSISDYDKYVLFDKGEAVQYCPGVVVPYHAKASSWYNNLLWTTASQYRAKYEFIKKGDKVKVYNVKDPVDDTHEMFAYKSGSYPSEFAPPVDVDKQFEKLILDPLNRYVEALGYQPIGAKLTYKAKLY